MIGGGDHAGFSLRPPSWLTGELERRGLLRPGWRARGIELFGPRVSEADREARSFLIELAAVFREQAEHAQHRLTQFFAIGFIVGLMAGAWLTWLVRR